MSVIRAPWAVKRDDGVRVAASQVQISRLERDVTTLLVSAVATEWKTKMAEVSDCSRVGRVEVAGVGAVVVVVVVVGN